ncbi:divalent cation tolerance protein CutA [Streptomyces virginiae]|uniref:divalent cation tolerance protein CutA n=1 Tax=Streptomyces virginiae TaxID=1961 RepID=UPI003868D267|nr:divalent-cation tolerance protein CutA [Streptomyces virginiae]
MTFRTTGDRREALEKHLVDNHPYDSPEVIAFTIDAGRAEYLDRITRATRQPFARSSSAPTGASDRWGSNVWPSDGPAPSV